MRVGGMHPDPHTIYCAILCNTVHCYAILCNTVQCDSNTVQYCAILCTHHILCNTVHCYAMLCNTAQCCAILCNTVQYCAIICTVCLPKSVYKGSCRRNYCYTPAASARRPVGLWHDTPPSTRPRVLSHNALWSKAAFGIFDGHWWPQKNKKILLNFDTSELKLFGGEPHYLPLPRKFLNLLFFTKKKKKKKISWLRTFVWNLKRRVFKGNLISRTFRFLS